MNRVVLCVSKSEYCQQKTKKCYSIYVLFWSSALWFVFKRSTLWLENKSFKSKMDALTVLSIWDTGCTLIQFSTSCQIFGLWSPSDFDARCLKLFNIKANFQISIWIFAPKRYQTCCKNETFLPFSNTKHTVSFIATYYTQKYVKDESSTLWKAHRGSTHYCTRKMFLGRWLDKMPWQHKE